MAEHAHTPSARRPATPLGTGGRRSLAAGIAALALAVPTLASTGLHTAKASPNPDADLIRLCSEFDALERELHGLNGDFRPGDREEAVWNATWDRVGEAQDVILDAIERHTPTTLAGVAALARTALIEEAALHAADPHTRGGRVLWHLVETLAEGRA